MANLDDGFLDDSSSTSSLTPSQSASQLTSQSPGSFTISPHAGGDAFSTLRRARSVKDQLEAVDEANLPIEVSQLPKIWIHGKPYIKTMWLHKKRKRRSKVDEHGERYEGQPRLTPPSSPSISTCFTTTFASPLRRWEVSLSCAQSETCLGFTIEGLLAKQFAFLCIFYTCVDVSLSDQPAQQKYDVWVVLGVCFSVKSDGSASVVA